MERKNNSNLQELILKDKIIGVKCSECDQLLTEENYREKNWTLWFSIDDYKWEDDPTDPCKHKLTLNIFEITHEKTSFFNCPDTEICSGCDKKFLAEKTKSGLYEEKEQGRKSYWCEPCFNSKYGDYLKERSKKKELEPNQKEILKVAKKALNEHLASNYHRGGHDFSKCEGSECEGYQQTLESYGIK